MTGFTLIKSNVGGAASTTGMTSAMLNTMLTGTGAPGLEVETVVANREVMVGHMLEGLIEIAGGTSILQIQAVTLDLVVRALIHDDKGGEPHHGLILLAVATAATDITLEPGDAVTLPFKMEIPRHAPLSLGVSTAGLRTHVAVEGAADAGDGDAVRLLPDRWTAAVLDAMETLDFRLAESDVEHVPGDPCPFFQRFRFRPMSLKDVRVECVDLSFTQKDDGVDVAVTVENRGGLFSRAHEEEGSLQVNDQVLAEGPDKVLDLLRDEIARLKGSMVA
jgi:sporulation-control protein